MSLLNGVELFSSGIGDLYYPSNDMDPYIKDKNDDEPEDMIIFPTNSVIVSARNEGDSFSLLEVWIFEDREMNMYVHHEIEIPTFPLCTAWLDCPTSRRRKRELLSCWFDGTFHRNLGP